MTLVPTWKLWLIFGGGVFLGVLLGFMIVGLLTYASQTSRDLENFERMRGAFNPPARKP